MKSNRYTIIIFLIVVFCSCDFKKSENNISNQNHSDMKCFTYVPETGSYKIYVPESFEVSESEDGILTIQPKDTSSTPELMTISSYKADSNVDVDFLTNFLNSITEKYKRIEEIVEIKNSNSICVRGIYTKDNLNWIWICLGKDQRILIISIHKKSSFDQELLSQYSFIIDHIEIL